jgi:A/G-specific adenine glycosylase
MELGATVCTKRSPACARCPLAEDCVSRERGNAEQVPLAAPKKARPLLLRAALRLVRADGQVLLQRQPAGALFEGLWDLPALEPEGRAHESLRAAAASLARALGSRGAPVHRARVEQTLTHREMRVEIFAASAGKRDPAAGDESLRWSAPDADALAKLGLSSLARKSLAASAG